MLPPLIEYLLNEFDLRGALVIVAAIHLNLIVFGSCLRPLKISTPDSDDKDEESTDTTTTSKDLLPVTERADTTQCYSSSERKPIVDQPLLIEKWNQDDLKYDQLNQKDANIIAASSFSEKDRSTFEHSYDRTEPVIQEKRSCFLSLWHAVKSLFGACFELEVLKAPQMVFFSISVFLFKMGVPHAIFFLHSYFKSVDADDTIVTSVLAGTSLVEVSSVLGMGAFIDMNIVAPKYLYFIG